MYWYQVDTKGITFDARGEHTASLVGQKIFLNSGCGIQDRCFSGMIGLNLESNYWFECTQLHTPPAPRKQHTATVVGNLVYLIGGFQPATMYFLNDAITFDTRSLSWAWPALGGVKLLPRAGHTATLVGNNKIFVIGGYSDVDFYDNLYVLNTDQQSWEQPVVRGVRPTPRHGHSDTLVGTVIYIYGGHSQMAQSLSDLYSFDTVTFIWSKVQATGVTPPPLQGHTAILLSSKVYLFGGCSLGNGKSTCSNAVYQFDTKHSAWKQIRAQGAQPSPRQGHTAVIVGTRMYIIAGCLLDQECYSNAYYLDTYPCQGSCSFNGLCLSGQCQCYPGFSGPVCDQIEVGCPGNCSMRGVCNNGTCACHGGFIGADCMTAAAGAGGALNETYSHLTADVISAQVQGNPNPTPQRKDVIDFRRPGQALAPAPTSGAASCLNDCSGHGQCNQGKCFCFLGYAAPDCSVAKYYAPCPNSCNAKGVCVYGKCQCFSGFSGSECSISAPVVYDPTGCPLDCSGHGTCTNDVCLCFPGYYSDDCHSVATPRCLNDCSGHGSCDNTGTCICQWGFSGDSCSITRDSGDQAISALFGSEKSPQLQGSLSSTNLTINVVHQKENLPSTAAQTQKSSAQQTPAPRKFRPPPTQQNSVASALRTTTALIIEPPDLTPPLVSPPDPPPPQESHLSSPSLPDNLASSSSVLQPDPPPPPPTTKKGTVHPPLAYLHRQTEDEIYQESLETLERYLIYAAVLLAVGAVAFLLLQLWNVFQAKHMETFKSKNYSEMA